jgi:hypothetical protein
VTLELAREERPASRTCRICGKTVPERICVDCGIDIETGDLVAPPAPPPEPTRDGSRPVRREAAREDAKAPGTTRELLARGVAVSLDGLPGTIACLLIVAFALSFRTLPQGDAIPWPGMFGATFVLAFLVIERARAAHEGPGGRIGTSGAFDPGALGSSILLAMLLFPLFAGTFGSGPVVGFGIGLPVALIFPGLLGALVCDGWSELAPDRLKDAFWRSPNYVGTTFYSMLALATSLSAVWLVDGSPVWRAPIAVGFATLAGTLCGLMRRDAESVVQE